MSLYQYFKSLSNQDGKIDIGSFNKAFEDKDYMTRITASLFTYLDKPNKGFVTFPEFFLKFYPNIDRNQLKAVCEWVRFVYSQVEKTDAYRDDFGKFIKNGMTSKLKPRVPEKGLKKLKKAFDKYDTAGEGSRLM